MSISIKTITDESQNYKVLYYKNIPVYGASRLYADVQDAECINKWITESIDLIVKSHMIVCSSNPAAQPKKLTSDAAISLLLSTKSNIWLEYIKTCDISDNVFPETWNITKGTELCAVTKHIEDDILHALSAINTDNSIVIDRHVVNRIKKIKTSISKTKTRNADLVSLTNTYVRILDEDITAHRLTYQIQKTTDGIKTRKSSQVEDVSMLIDRELTPLRHLGAQRTDAIKNIVEKLVKLGVPKEVIASKELDAALEEHTTAIRIIETALQLDWKKVHIQASLLKQTGYDSFDAIHKILTSVEAVNENVINNDIEMPLF